MIRRPPGSLGDRALEPQRMKIESFDKRLNHMDGVVDPVIEAFGQAGYLGPVRAHHETSHPTLLIWPRES